MNFSTAFTLYILAFLVCAIINVHLSTREVAESDLDTTKLKSVLVASLWVGIFWPLYLLFSVVLYSGLLLTKLRQKDV